MSEILRPKELYDRIARQVIDQDLAIQQISVALFKHIRQLKVGNILLIGNSGTGKTTIMRAVERLFAEDPHLSSHLNTIRLNANIVAEDDSSHLETSIILTRLAENAQRIAGTDISVNTFKSLMENSVVFLDEVDKIRAYVGERPNPRGILAQESLLTLIEGEGVSLPCSHRNSNGEWVREQVLVDTGRILFICGGAFEGLYDMVYKRVAGGEHRDKLVQEYLIEENHKDLHEKVHFSLKDYVRYEDLFDYGMVPQFLGRFDEIIVLNELSINALMRIFVEPPESPLREARKYFRSMGVELQINKDALRWIAERAQEESRLGARALRMVLKRVLRGIEYDPVSHPLVRQDGEKRILTITRELVEHNS